MSHDLTKISVGKLQRAFGLAVEECFALINAIPAYDAMNICRKGHDFTVDEQIALAWASFTFRESKDFKMAAATLNLFAKEERGQGDNAAFDAVLSAPRGSVPADVYIDMIKCALIYCLHVDKAEAVFYFKSHGFPLKEEVKGITRELFDLVSLPTQFVPQREEQSRIPVNVPASIWAGKTPEAVYISLGDQDFAPAVIASIIMEKVGGISKTDAGRLFYKDEIDKGIIQENRTYQRKIDSLLAEASEKFTFTFDG